MNNESAFLDAIKASPDDQAMRLVYADWLEEQGQTDKSEYIRGNEELLTLISTADLGEAPQQARYRRLRGRLRKLAKTIAADWTAFFDAIRPTIYHCCVCRRVITGSDAIAINPRTQTRMKNTRYCKLCWEDAIRSYLHRGSGFDSMSGRRSADLDYHGSGDHDD